MLKEDRSNQQIGGGVQTRYKACSGSQQWQIQLKWTYLWCVFLTQGKALSALIITAVLVTTPMMSTASCWTLRVLNMVTTLNSSQMQPDSAQPLWIPPRCLCLFQLNEMKYNDEKLPNLQDRGATQTPPDWCPLYGAKVRSNSNECSDEL